MTDGNRDVTMPPISRAGGYFLWAFYLAWFALTTARNSADEIRLGFVLCFNLLVGAPVFMLVDNLVAAITIGALGVQRKGFLGLRSAWNWADVHTIVLHSGRGDYRELRLEGVHGRLAWTNMRPAFWPAARRVLREAEAREIPVRASLGTQGDNWFAVEPR
ncbi:MAG: hypothetical protein KBC05_10525 [Candidatus Hydrogenedentes bacterium]|nr:hypothetical protein [Candidatus Hydrogenedentota bacterium]